MGYVLLCKVRSAGRKDRIYPDPTLPAGAFYESDHEEVECYLILG